jgi:hypothetical protein
MSTPRQNCEFPRCRRPATHRAIAGGGAPNHLSAFVCTVHAKIANFGPFFADHVEPITNTETR